MSETVMKCRRCGTDCWERPSGACEGCERAEAVAARNALVEANMKLAENAARVMFHRVHGRVEYGDLLSGACLGLMRAAEQFDPSVGVRFTTFADRRVRGAIVDQIRDLDSKTRNQRDRTKALAKAADAFFVRHGRKPSEDELLAEAGITADDYAEVWKTSTVGGREVPLEFQHRASGRIEVGYGHARKPSDMRKPGCSVPVHSRTRRGSFVQPLTPVAIPRDGDVDTLDWWDAAVAGLSRREKMLVLMYYRDGLTMRECGAAAGISESMASLVLKGVRERLQQSDSMKRLLAAEVRDAA